MLTVTWDTHITQTRRWTSTTRCMFTV